MSVTISYPSEYFKASLSAKDRISDSIKLNFKANAEGYNPLHNLIAQNNDAEIKFLIKEHKEHVIKAMGVDAEILQFVESASIFKLLHDVWQKTADDYTFDMFESAFGLMTGVSLINYITRVKEEHKEDVIKKDLTGLSFYNFGKNYTWTANKTLTENAKGELSAGNIFIKAAVLFFDDYLGSYSKHKSKYQYQNPENGLTVLHELAQSDKNLGKLVFLIKHFKLNPAEFIDAEGNTVLKTAIEYGCKKIVYYLLEVEKLDINDSYNFDEKEPMNSACALVSNYNKFVLRGEEYLKKIDESEFTEEDINKSCVCWYGDNNKADLHNITPMNDELLELQIPGRKTRFRKVINGSTQSTSKAPKGKTKK